MTGETAEPAVLVPDALIGALVGSNERYEKMLGDLAGLYRDESAFAAGAVTDDGSPVYWVESSTLDSDAGALTIGVSSVKPGMIGDEYAMTRGHIHGIHGRAELYYGLSGNGVMLLDSLDGRTRALEIAPGRAVHVPGHWVHRSVNVGDSLLTTLFCYPSDAGQDYGIIEAAGGMRSLVVRGPHGWQLRDNPDHTGYRP